MYLPAMNERGLTQFLLIHILKTQETIGVTQDCVEARQDLGPRCDPCALLSSNPLFKCGEVQFCRGQTHQTAPELTLKASKPSRTSSPSEQTNVSGRPRAGSQVRSWSFLTGSRRTLFVTG